MYYKVGPAGLLSSTVIDFRVGRLLGVAFVGSIGEHDRSELATEMALALEKTHRAGGSGRTLTKRQRHPDFAGLASNGGPATTL